MSTRAVHRFAKAALAIVISLCMVPLMSVPPLKAPSAAASISPSEVTAVTGCTSCGEDIDIVNQSIDSSSSGGWVTVVKKSYPKKKDDSKGKKNKGKRSGFSFSFKAEVNVKTGHSRATMNISGTFRGVTITDTETVTMDENGNIIGAGTGNSAKVGPATVDVDASIEKNGDRWDHDINADIRFDARACPRGDAICRQAANALQWDSGKKFTRMYARFDFKYPAGYPWGCQENEQGNWRCPGDAGFWRDRPKRPASGSPGTQPPVPAKGQFTCQGNKIRYYSNGSTAYRQMAENGRTHCPGVQLVLHVYSGGKVVDKIQPPGANGGGGSGGGSGTIGGRYNCDNGRTYFVKGKQYWMQAPNRDDSRTCPDLRSDGYQYMGWRWTPTGVDLAA